jgi:hypothetical protein
LAGSTSAGFLGRRRSPRRLGHVRRRATGHWWIYVADDSRGGGVLGLHQRSTETASRLARRGIARKDLDRRCFPFILRVLGRRSASRRGFDPLEGGVGRVVSSFGRSPVCRGLLVGLHPAVRSDLQRRQSSVDPGPLSPTEPWRGKSSEFT